MFVGTTYALALHLYRGARNNPFLIGSNLLEYQKVPLVPPIRSFKSLALLDSTEINTKVIQFLRTTTVTERQDALHE